MIQPMLAAAATTKATMPTSGLKPGTSLSAFLASWAGQPVSLAIQNSQISAPSMVSTITENQSIALIAPRFMVGRPKAAISASGASILRKSPFSSAGSHSSSTVRARKKNTGMTMCSRCCWRRQAQVAHTAKGQAGQKNQTPMRKKPLSVSRVGRPTWPAFQSSQSPTGDRP